MPVPVDVGLISWLALAGCGAASGPWFGVGGAGGRDARSGPSGRFVFLSLLLLFWVARGRLRVVEQRALCRGPVLFERELVLSFDLASIRLVFEIVKGGCDRRDDRVDRYLSMFAQKNAHLVSLVDCCDVELFFCVVCVWNQKCFLSRRWLRPICL